MTELLPERTIVPLDYSGRWIAWDQSLTTIIASGMTLDEAYAAAINAGESQPIMDKAPHAEIRFVGGPRLEIIPVD